jgi:KUP system potassium uptake protein
VFLSAAAAVIASQAVISGAFSLTRQAVQLGFCPRVAIRHTSPEEIGQIYVPSVNWALLVATVALVFAFRTSESLAAAYGVAVTTTMVITTLLFHVLATRRWRWKRAAVLPLTAAFLTADLSFFGANVIKIEHGGYVPLALGAAVFLLLSTWKRGRAILARRLEDESMPLDLFLADIQRNPPLRVPGTAFFGIPPNRVVELGTQIEL